MKFKLMWTTMKGRSEKLYDPSSLDVHFCHAISLCNKHFPIVLKVQIPLSRHYGVLFPDQSHLCFPSMSIKTMRHYLSSVHFKFSDLSECCKKLLVVWIIHIVNVAFFGVSVNRSFSLFCFSHEATRKIYEHWFLFKDNAANSSRPLVFRS